jgi:hypothetical protein
VLSVEFKDGKRYHYMAVPEEVWLGLLGAPSHGSFLNREIKGRYRYQGEIS